jgi:hypothetical protein
MRLAIPAALAAALLGTAAFAQTMDHGAPMHGTMPMHMQHNMPGTIGSLPTQPGQDMFGAVQEIVGMLVADPATDWSKVNLDALREHLIDMNEVALHAKAATGTGRTLLAIRRMLPEHTREMNGTNGWAMQAESRPDGITVTVTSADAKQVAIIRGLGFIGVMASGDHHRMHHIMMAKGQM